MRKFLSVLLLLFVLLTSLGAGPASAGLGLPGLSTVYTDPALSAALASARPTDQLRVVAMFQSPLSVLQRSSLLSAVTAGQALNELPMALLVATPAQLSLVKTLPGLKSLYLDKQLHFAMAESVQVTGASRVWNELGYDGSGVTVAVIDSGIDGLHPDLSGDKVIANVKIVGHSDLAAGLYQAIPLPNTDTSSGHGTHVAGSVAGTGSASGGHHTGIAPGASLVGVGTGDAIFIFTALEAFDWVMANQDALSIDIITNSWGTTGTFDGNDPINTATKAAHDAGMVVLFASGNEGPSNNTLNPYSVAPWVIGVAAGNKDGRTLADFSSRGRPGDALYHPTVTAPGVDIVSTRAANTVLPALGAPSDINMNPSWLPYYTTMSGTSMATPQVAGIVALIRQANPSLSPDAIKQLLVSTATPMPGYSEYQVGAGYVNAFAAVQQAAR
ncbi:MAG: S8 family serine peptidase [Ardenticatenales bacterium]|nr:S8 family serine peptidase [Ardenticatenales bacterium]